MKIRCPYCKGLNHAKVQTISHAGVSVPFAEKTILNGDSENEMFIPSTNLNLFGCLRCGTVFMPMTDCETVLERQNQQMEIIAAAEEGEG